VCQIDESDTLEPTRQRVDGAQAEREGRVSADVAVDKQPTARFEHASGLSEHLNERVLREVFQHVQGVCLVERPVRDRKATEIADHEVDFLAGLVRKVRADIDTGQIRPSIAIPDHDPPAAAPEIEHPIVSAQVQKRAEHFVSDCGSE
jgi:hypothetical protein